MHNGKSLQEWFDSLSPPGMYSEHDPNVRAIVAIGSDAVPFLMRELCSSKSSWSEGFRKLWSKIGLVRRPFTSANYRRSKAYYALIHLGPKADPALPELIKIAEDERHPDRAFAIGLLGYTRSAPTTVIPILQKLLANPREPYFETAIFTLAMQGTNACPVIPRLKEIEADAGIPICDRIFAASATVSIDPAARPSLEFIVAQWDNTNASRNIILEVLDGLGTNAAPALPAMRRMVRTESDAVWRAPLSNSIHSLETKSERVVIKVIWPVR